MSSVSSSPEPEVLSEAQFRSYAEEDCITCRWNGCDTVYRDLQKLIDHIHNEHIGSHKSSYSCEWETCHRKGLSQTSRFALISHVRSHTGEKPFLCVVPECDKSFTRSDALAKHMRLQHGIDPPAPGRGGTRKRKRSSGMRSPSPSGSMTPSFGGNGAEDEPLHHHYHHHNYYTHPHPHHRLTDLDPAEAELRRAEEIYLRRSQGSRRHLPPSTNGVVHVQNGGVRDELDELPPHLKPRVDPATKTIDGRPIEMVLYIITKAKYKYCLEQNDYLRSELDRAMAELEIARREKDEALDDVLRATYGGEADRFIEEPAPPQPRIREIANGLSAASSPRSTEAESLYPVHPPSNN